MPNSRLTGKGNLIKGLPLLPHLATHQGRFPHNRLQIKELQASDYTEEVSRKTQRVSSLGETQPRALGER